MHLPTPYHLAQVIDAARLHGRDLHLQHRRTLRDRGPKDGVVSRTIGWLRSQRAGVHAPLVFEAHELTDRVCRLASGQMGLVALRESEAGWTATCVPHEAASGG